MFQTVADFSFFIHILQQCRSHGFSARVSREVLKHCFERLAERSNIEWSNLPV